MFSTAFASSQLPAGHEDAYPSAVGRVYWRYFAVAGGGPKHLWRDVFWKTLGGTRPFGKPVLVVPEKPEVLRGCLWLFGEYCEDQATHLPLNKNCFFPVKKSLASQAQVVQTNRLQEFVLRHWSRMWSKLCSHPWGRPVFVSNEPVPFGLIVERYQKDPQGQTVLLGRAFLARTPRGKQNRTTALCNCFWGPCHWC